MISRGYMELFIKPSRRYEIAASLPFAADLLAWCRENPPPDLVILDVMMASGVDGLTAAGEIKRRWPQVRIIVTTSMADTDWLEKAQKAGVESFWFKTYSDISLLEMQERRASQMAQLTNQQRRLLHLLVEGLSNREIGQKLYLSPNTVKDYLDDLMEKTGIHSRTALVAQASRLGIVVSDADRVKDKTTI